MGSPGPVVARLEKPMTWKVLNLEDPELDLLLRSKNGNGKRLCRDSNAWIVFHTIP